MGPIFHGWGVGAAAGSAGVAGAGVCGVEEVSVCAAAITPAARAKDAVSVRRPDLKSIKGIRFLHREIRWHLDWLFSTKIPLRSRYCGLRQHFNQSWESGIADKADRERTNFGLPVLIHSTPHRNVVFVDRSCDYG
jgi:hypothetical protein